MAGLGGGIALPAGGEVAAGGAGGSAGAPSLRTAVFTTVGLPLAQIFVARALNRIVGLPCSDDNTVIWAQLEQLLKSCLKGFARLLATAMHHQHVRVAERIAVRANSSHVIKWPKKLENSNKAPGSRDQGAHDLKFNTFRVAGSGFIDRLVLIPHFTHAITFTIRVYADPGRTILVGTITPGDSCPAPMLVPNPCYIEANPSDYRLLPSEEEAEKAHNCAGNATSHVENMRKEDALACEFMVLPFVPHALDTVTAVVESLLAARTTLSSSTFESTCLRTIVETNLSVWQLRDSAPVVLPLATRALAIEMIDRAILDWIQPLIPLALQCRQRSPNDQPQHDRKGARLARDAPALYYTALLALPPITHVLVTWSTSRSAPSRAWLQASISPPLTLALHALALRACEEAAARIAVETYHSLQKAWELDDPNMSRDHFREFISELEAQELEQAESHHSTPDSEFKSTPDQGMNQLTQNAFTSSSHTLEALLEHKETVVGEESGRDAGVRTNEEDVTTVSNADVSPVGTESDAASALEYQRSTGLDPLAVINFLERNPGRFEVKGHVYELSATTHRLLEFAVVHVRWLRVLSLAGVSISHVHPEEMRLKPQDERTLVAFATALSNLTPQREACEHESPAADESGSSMAHMMRTILRCLGSRVGHLSRIIDGFIGPPLWNVPHVGSALTSIKPTQVPTTHTLFLSCFSLDQGTGGDTPWARALSTLSESALPFDRPLFMSLFPELLPCPGERAHSSAIVVQQRLYSRVVHPWKFIAFGKPCATLSLPLLMARCGLTGSARGQLFDAILSLDATRAWACPRPVFTFYKLDAVAGDDTGRLALTSAVSLPGTSTTDAASQDEHQNALVLPYPTRRLKNFTGFIHRPLALCAGSMQFNMLTTLPQLIQQLAVTHPRSLRCASGEYPWSSRFTGTEVQGAIGVPGMFRQVLAEVSSEIQSAASGESGAVGLGRFFIRTANAGSNVGDNRNALMPHPARVSDFDLTVYYHIGQIIGLVLRSRSCLDVEFADPVWEALLGIFPTEAWVQTERSAERINLIEAIYSFQPQDSSASSDDSASAPWNSQSDPASAIRQAATSRSLAAFLPVSGGIILPPQLASVNATAASINNMADGGATSFAQQTEREVESQLRGGIPLSRDLSTDGEVPSRNLQTSIDELVAWSRVPLPARTQPRTEGESDGRAVSRAANTPDKCDNTPEIHLDPQDFTFSSVYTSLTAEQDWIPYGSLRSLAACFSNSDAALTQGFRAWAVCHERSKVTECWLQLRSMRAGLLSIVPALALRLLDKHELRDRVCGAPEIDISLLRRITVIRMPTSGNVSNNEAPSSEPPAVRFFWQVMEEMNQTQRAKFLRFAWARSRLPADTESNAQAYRMQLNILDIDEDVLNRAKTSDPEGAGYDSRLLPLPTSETCFFNVNLPNYPTLEIMREKLYFAIEHCASLTM